MPQTVQVYLNDTKTEYTDISQNTDVTFQLKTLAGDILKRVDGYKYLGSYIRSSKKKFETRKGMV